MSDAAPRIVGVVTGLAVESRLISQNPALPDGVLLSCAGADSRRAESCAERHVAQGAGALMSFGIAGALDPQLTAGELVLAARVTSPDAQHYPVDPAWHQTVAAILSGEVGTLRHGAILGSPEALFTAQQKAAALTASGCLAVDMESHAVARVAARHGLPFLVLRAIADTAEDGLPSFASGVITAEGETAMLKALTALTLRPWQLPAALRLSRRSKLALAALEKVSRNPAVLFRSGR